MVLVDELRLYTMMEKPKICFGIVMLIVAAIGVIYISTQHTKVPPSADVNAQPHTPEVRDLKGFKWFKHWDELNLDVIKKFYQRYTRNEMHILWHDKLFSQYGNQQQSSADTVYPWDGYIAQLLEFGHPFMDFSDYESALDTLRSVLIPARTYWQTLTTTERETYLSARRLPPNTSWETYQASLIKQCVVYRINWWRSGGIDPF